MKYLGTSAVLGVFLTIASPVAAQPVEPAASTTRFDVAGYAGAFSAHKARLDEYDSWYTSPHGGATLGFYWTDHWKTEVDIGGSGKGEMYEFRQLGLGSVNQFVYVEHTFQTMQIALGQHYQFFQNAWFHPSVGAGVTVTRERQTQEIPPVYLASTGRPTGPPIEVVPAQTIGPDTHIDYRPFVTTGFKAYLSRRSFFRSDVKAVLGKSVEDVTVRFGIGVDF